MPRAVSNVEKKICDVALKLAARRGWSALTLEEIAAAAKIAPAAFRKHFADKNQILPAVVRQIDRHAAAVAGKTSAKSAPHDRLFEIMMARFDALQKERRGILAILTDASRDPALARSIVPAQWRSMQEMLDLARLCPQGLRRIAAAVGLMGVYYRTLCAWKRDETPDMAKTMAALDRALRQAETIAEMIFRGA
jgi:AcrR family transcriptional regulator